MIFTSPSNSLKYVVSSLGLCTKHCRQTKLESVTGISVDSQRVTLHDQGTEEDESAKIVAVLDANQRPLGYYNIRDWQVLKVSLFAFLAFNMRIAQNYI